MYVATLLPLLLFGRGVLSAEFKINSADEFVAFSYNVNSGTTFDGTTVLLNSDIDLSGKTLEPIGTKNDYYFFRGSFDGQGHMISNLTIKSTSYYVGLFGYSGGAIIKNFVVDSSSSITASLDGLYEVQVGGIVGYNELDDIPCNIENIVNMGNITSIGGASNSYLYLGGIVGRVYSWIPVIPVDSEPFVYNYENILKNCVNYGSISHVGSAEKHILEGLLVSLQEAHRQPSFTTVLITDQ